MSPLNIRSSKVCEFDTRASRDDGFVLPQVLLGIAVLSIIAFGAANRLSRVVDTVRSAESVQIAEMRLQSAKATSIFLWMTASPQSSGFDLNGGQSGDALLFSGASASLNEDAEIDLWVPDGTVYAFGDLRVAWRDAAGLVSLISAPQELKSQFLTHLDVDPIKARRLAAALEDYQDPNLTRRFNGAERVEYRRAGLMEPPNRSIASHDELLRVLGWREVLLGESGMDILELTTVNSFEPYMRVAYVHPKLAQVDGGQLSSINILQIDPLAANPLSSIPSNVTRMEISVDVPTPRTLVFEVSREVVGISVPYTTNPVYLGSAWAGALRRPDETNGLDGAARLNEGGNVIQGRASLAFTSN